MRSIARPCPAAVLCHRRSALLFRKIGLKFYFPDIDNAPYLLDPDPRQ